MNWFGPAITGALGLFLILSPQSFPRSSGDGFTDDEKRRHVRTMGLFFLTLSFGLSILNLIPK